MLDVRLILTDDLIRDLITCICILKLNRRTKNNFALCIDLCHINDLAVSKLAFNLLDAPFSKALLFTRRVILGILLEISVGSCLGNGLGDLGTHDGLQMGEFCAQLLGTAQGQGYFLHGVGLSRQIVQFKVR